MSQKVLVSPCGDCKVYVRSHQLTVDMERLSQIAFWQRCICLSRSGLDLPFKRFHSCGIRSLWDNKEESVVGVKRTASTSSTNPKFPTRIPYQSAEMWNDRRLKVRRKGNVSSVISIRLRNERTLFMRQSNP